MDEGTRFLLLSLGGESYAIPIRKLLEMPVPRQIQRGENLTELFEYRANGSRGERERRPSSRNPLPRGRRNIDPKFVKGLVFDDDQEITILDFERLLHAG